MGPNAACAVLAAPAGERECRSPFCKTATQGGATIALIFFPLNVTTGSSTVSCHDTPARPRFRAKVEKECILLDRQTL